jgi:hypothetical protein
MYVLPILNLKINGLLHLIAYLNKLSMIFVDSTQFAILMNYALKNVSVEIIYDEDVDADKLYINFLSGKSKGFDHFLN